MPPVPHFPVRRAGLGNASEAEVVSTGGLRILRRCCSGVANRVGLLTFLSRPRHVRRVPIAEIATLTHVPEHKSCLIVAPRQGGAFTRGDITMTRALRKTTHEGQLQGSQP